jgi:hypothetical protein
MTELTVGRVVQGLQARYTVERALGAGGFGMTYLARRGDGEAVVLKQLRLARMTDWKALELFEREARVLAALSHPGIPKLYEFFALDGESPRAPAALYSSVAGPSPAAPPSPSLSLVIAQAYVEGRSLQAWIDEGGRWAADDAEAVLRRLLDVLKYLHSLNPPVIHRDIKPANVVLGTDGKAYLVDFGAIQDRLRGTAEAGSTTVGSFGFFPQEQLLGKARPASDLYALGMTLMCALTHLQPEELPLDEQTSKVQVRVAAPYLPERLARALEAMLEPAVGQRAATTDEVAGILDGLTPASAMAAAAPRAGAGAQRAERVAGPVARAADRGDRRDGRGVSVDVQRVLGDRAGRDELPLGTGDRVRAGAAARGVRPAGQAAGRAGAGVRDRVVRAAGVLLRGDIPGALTGRGGRCGTVKFGG